MSREIIKQEINHAMETIAEQWEIIRAYEGKIPFIEMDIFMDNIRKVYEDLMLIDKMNKAPGFNPERIKSRITHPPAVDAESLVKQEPPIAESKEKSAVTADMPPADNPAAQPEANTTEMMEPEADVKHDPPVAEEPEQEPSMEQEPVFESFSEPQPLQQTAEEKPQTLVDKIIDEPVQNKDEIKASWPEPETTAQPADMPEPKKPATQPMPDLFGSYQPTLAEKFQIEKKSIKDQLAANGSDNSIGNKMQQSQIADLKSVIGINDKFLLINELFKGDLAGYNRAIQSLNVCRSRHEALEKLDEMRVQLNWHEQAASYQRLTDFIKRRYAV
ncbi:MAG TPA: hypothetical protein ENN08_07885 [Bacteroidales bacterium]|nr:hypothetical protein [Bacteroidales bacterium]